jgi:hypothetical protein
VLCEWQRKFGGGACCARSVFVANSEVCVILKMHISLSWLPTPRSCERFFESPADADLSSTADEMDLVNKNYFHRRPNIVFKGHKEWVWCVAASDAGAMCSGSQVRVRGLRRVQRSQ